MTLQARLASGINMLLFLYVAASGISTAEAKALYSYADEKGTRIITDNYDNIPRAYRAKVTTVEQETEGSLTEGEHIRRLPASAKGFLLRVPGMSMRQSQIMTYAGTFALLCLLAMSLSRGAVIRALALWCLVLTGICAPVLIYIADDGAAAIMKNKAAQIQQKQQDRLSHAQ